MPKETAKEREFPPLKLSTKFMPRPLPRPAELVELLDQSRHAEPYPTPSRKSTMLQILELGVTESCTAC